MIIVLGAFDGYHLGHQKLFEEASRISSIESKGWAVISFTPHPKIILFQEKVSLLFTEEEKKILGKVLKVPTSLFFPFTSEVANMGAIDFFNRIDSDFGLSGIVVGHDFHFGKDRSGTIDTLASLCREKDIPCSVVPPFMLNDEIVSSTSIRSFVARGKMERASKFLGYPFFMKAPVVTGNRRGKAVLGHATANLDIPSIKIVPDPGVYGGAAFVEGVWKPAAISIGKNRTFGDVKDMRTEVHIVGYDGDLYGKALNVLFFKKIRAAYQFPSVDRLKVQLKMDVAESKKIFLDNVNSLSIFSRIDS